MSGGIRCQASLKRERLVLVTSTVPISVRTLLAPQIAALSSRGYLVEVVTSPGSDSLVDLDGVSLVHQIDMSREVSPMEDVKSLHQWVRLIRVRRPEVVLAFSPKASLLSMLAARLCGVPVRVYSTGGLRLETTHGLRRWILRCTERLTCSAATHVVANSRSLASAYGQLGMGRNKLSWTMSRKGVDHEEFKPVANLVPTPVEGSPAVPVVGFVGRLVPDKGLQVLAQALELLRNSGVGVRILLVGPSEVSESAQLVAAIRDACPASTVVGAVEDPRSAYAAMDLLVLPSAREGFPNVVIEAAAMQVPAVVSDATGCIDSVVPGQTGLIHSRGDAADLAAKIEILVRDPEYRIALGREARRRVVREFDPSEVVSRQLDLMGLKGGTGDD